VTCALLVAACNGTGDANPALAATDPLSRSSVIASASPAFATPTGPVLHWYSDLVWSGDVSETSDDSASVLTRALEQELGKKGYRFTAQASDADYDVLAVAVLGDIAAHPEIEQLFRLYPSLRGGGSYESGNVLFAVAPAGTTEIVWRGAIEVFTGEQFSDEIRHLRIRKASEMLLGSIPPAPTLPD
jgi:hypothetical protein